MKTYVSLSATEINTVVVLLKAARSRNGKAIAKKIEESLPDGIASFDLELVGPDDYELGLEEDDGA